MVNPCIYKRHAQSYSLVIIQGTDSDRCVSTTIYWLTQNIFLIVGAECQVSVCSFSSYMCSSFITFRLTAHLMCGLMSDLMICTCLDIAWSYMTPNILTETRCH